MLNTNHRRSIRFAPLPDPRRSVLIADDGGEFPIPLETELESEDSSNESLSAIPASLSLAALDSPARMSADLPPDSSSNSSNSISETPSSSAFTSVTSLTPTQTRTLSSGTPTQPNFPQPPKLSAQILSLGTINLFRTSSRARDDDDNASIASSLKGGLKLQRWTSGGSTVGDTKSKQGGVPMHRTSSYTPGMKWSSKSSGSFFSSKSKSNSKSDQAKENGLISTLHTGSSSNKKGTRMLNGRVYGGARKPAAAPAANPFANAKDEDPEFVEWGYGGMGSVKNGAGVGGRVWGKLMTDNSAVGAEDEDDGSGMGWVRKRREAKERAEREKAEAEAKAKEAEEANSGDTADDPPAPKPEEKADVESAQPSPQPETTEPPSLDKSLSKPTSPTHSRKPSLQKVPMPILSPSSPSTPQLGPQSMSYSSQSGRLSPIESAAVPDEKHVLSAVKIPARYRKHSQHSHHDRDKERVVSDPVPWVTEQPQYSSSSSSSSSDSDSESDDDEREEEEDSEDEPEDEETLNKRKTCLGAGVEKISRHK